MRITKIDIFEYRSCLETKFEPNPNLSVLIGPNSSGKTNILNALLLLKKLINEEDYYYRSDTPPVAKCKIKVWFDLNGKKAILTAGIHIFTDERNFDVVIYSDQQWYVKDFTGNAKRFKTPLSLFRYLDADKINSKYYQLRFFNSLKFKHNKAMEFPENVSNAFLDILQYVSNMRYYSVSQFINPSKCPVSFEIEKQGKARHGIRLHGHAKFLFDLYNEYKTKSEGFVQFFDIIGPKGIGLIDNISFKEILTSSIDYRVRSGGKIVKKKIEKNLIIPQFTIGKHELSPNQLSEGTFKTITLLFYLITESSSILLIEEPEVCVHHGLLSSIIELIKVYSSGKQIIISTHSDFILDNILPENVYMTSNSPEDGTKIKHITEALSNQELSALREYLETQGNLGEYWRHGALED